MKASSLKHATILLFLAGSLFSCANKIGTDDIDMSNIDFSNIENLYEQPLPVIQKAVQGKWKVYSIYMSGVVYSKTYPENSFIEFKDGHYILDSDDGFRSIIYFTWEKYLVEDWISPLYGYETYMMCAQNQEDAIYSKLYFEYIYNDTLSFGTHQAPIGYYVVKVE